MGMLQTESVVLRIAVCSHSSCVPESESGLEMVIKRIKEALDFIMQRLQILSHLSSVRVRIWFFNPYQVSSATSREYK